MQIYWEQKQYQNKTILLHCIQGGEGRAGPRLNHFFTRHFNAWRGGSIVKHTFLLSAIQVS